MTRQQKRRELVRKHFRRLTGRETGVRPVGDLRRNRRAEARAFAAGEWKRLSAAKLVAASTVPAEPMGGM